MFFEIQMWNPVHDLGFSKTLFKAHCLNLFAAMLNDKFFTYIH